MNRRLRRAALWAASCAVAAALLVALLTDQSDPPAGAQIVVPQGQESESHASKTPTSSVSIPLPSPSMDTAPAPSTSERRQPVIPRPRPVAPTTVPQPAAVDYQAEDARVHKGWVASNHSGFTGAGFVDYDSTPGGSIEWTVTPAAAGGADIVFRYANGSAQARLLVVSVNGAPADYAVFPVTNGWSDWRMLTVRATLPAGTSKIVATAATQHGGPNVDKITLVSPA